MKIYYYFILLIIMQSSFVVAQVGIGTKNPDRSSALDLTSTSQGLLIPRMNSKQRDLIESPANGLIIYNITTQVIENNIGTKLNPYWVLVGNNGTTNKVVSLSYGNIFIGNSNNVASERQVSGEGTLDNSGVFKLNNDAVITKVLTGYKSGAGTITADDNIVQAIQKLDGNQSSYKIITTTTDYSLQLSDGTVICNTEAGSFTITLPLVSSCPGKVFEIKKIDETYNTLNINPPIQFTNRTTVSTLNYSKSFKIQSDGNVWFIIN